MEIENPEVGFFQLFGTKKRGFVTLFATYLQPDHPFLGIHVRHD